ncbi:MAG: proline dehydrogenase family protein [Deltaproteobacteria bacterium]|nr:proline dehydrogenase family protein [Deltaproteobacteria bacterium]
MSILTYLARRYVAGEDRADAIKVARALNQYGIAATLDNLGENVKTSEEAELSVKEYLSLLGDIASAGVDAAVSLKLTHLGLDLSDELAYENARRIIRSAHGYGNFVRFDMEGSAYTQRTIDILLRLRQELPNVGCALQTSLLRTQADAARLTDNGASIRLVKGAYKEPPSVAFKDKKDVDDNYSAIMKEILMRGNMPAIATHDERLINEATRFALENKIDKGSFEFEMLLGIKRALQKRLADEGRRVRVYVPYGKNWLPYMMRRLRERKENILFVVKNIFD